MELLSADNTHAIVKHFHNRGVSSQGTLGIREQMRRVTNIVVSTLPEGVVRTDTSVPIFIDFLFLDVSCFSQHLSSNPVQLLLLPSGRSLSAMSFDDLRVRR